MFLQGLTVLDVMDSGLNISLSHVTARQEVRELLKMLKIPAIDERIAEMRLSETLEHMKAERNAQPEEAASDAEEKVDIDLTPVAEKEKAESAASAKESAAKESADVVAA